MTDFVTNVEVRKTNSFRNKTNGDIPRTSSFQDRIEKNGSETPGGNEIEDILRRQGASTDTPRRGRQPIRSNSPLKGYTTYSPTRERSTSPMRRERSYLRSTSPDKLPFRKSAIWSQWEVNDKGKECLQEYNIKQMTGLYGKDLRGRVDVASEWYRTHGLDRSKTQTEALEWFSEDATHSASAPISVTPRGVQTEGSLSKTPSMTPVSFTPHGSMKFVGNPYKNREMKAREQLKEEKNINKLSHRNRVQRTPSLDAIRAREQKFTNDAIVTERRRTRFKDIIPQYDASADRHCKAYFKRQDVQQLIGVTRSREATPAGSVTPGVQTVRSTPRPTPGATPY